MKRLLTAALAAPALAGFLSACEPTVKIQPPDKPIVINMNIKIEQEVRVRVEKEADKLLQENSGLF